MIKKITNAIGGNVVLRNLKGWQVVCVGVVIGFVLPTLIKMLF